MRSIEFAPVLPNGHIGQWQYTAPFNIARSAAAVVVSGENIYILGGISNKQVLNSAEYAWQFANGHLGSKLESEQCQSGIFSCSSGIFIALFCY